MNEKGMNERIMGVMSGYEGEWVSEDGWVCDGVWV